jgi:hypothetical protein
MPGGGPCATAQSLGRESRGNLPGDLDHPPGDRHYRGWTAVIQSRWLWGLGASQSRADAPKAEPTNGLGDLANDPVQPAGDNFSYRK